MFPQKTRNIFSHGKRVFKISCGVCQGMTCQMYLSWRTNLCCVLLRVNDLMHPSKCLFDRKIKYLYGPGNEQGPIRKREMKISLSKLYAVAETRAECCSRNSYQNLRSMPEPKQVETFKTEAANSSVQTAAVRERVFFTTLNSKALTFKAPPLDGAETFFHSLARSAKPSKSDRSSQNFWAAAPLRLLGKTQQGPQSRGTGAIPWSQPCWARDKVAVAFATTIPHSAQRHLTPGPASCQCRCQGAPRSPTPSLPLDSRRFQVELSAGMRL